MINRMRISSFITAGLVAIALPTPILMAASAGPQVNDLSYRYFDTRIQLARKPNQVAIVFKPDSQVRGLTNSPNHLKLEAALRGETDTRTVTPPENLNVTVKPLGSRYAILTLPSTRSLDFQQKLNQRLDSSYVQTTLPIFQRQNIPEDNDETIILHDELIVTFEPGTSTADVQRILSRYDAEIVRSLRFTKNRYLVRSRTASGAALLPLIEQLNGVTRIQSASPNLIQAVSHHPNALPLTPRPKEAAIDPKTAAIPSANQPYPNSLLPYQWHLNSRKQKVLGPRTDVQAPEAWAQGITGQGSLVAVIDSAIQWDHPDLQSNLYEVPQTLPDLMPGERHGWDFSRWETAQTCAANDPKSCAMGDPETRLDAEELALIRPHFQHIFQFDAEILKTYSQLVDRIRIRNPKLSNSEIADIIRDYLSSEIAAEFHGTWVAGVIAAQPQATPGAIGVAPNAKLLPVRVFGLGGKISSDGLIEAIGYAAARNVDVINLSLGSLAPTQAEADQIFSVLDANPKLVIVASSGNSNLDGVGYPAAIPGVLSVGASNVEGNRAPYSNYGRRLDVLAPGGDTSVQKKGGIFTTGGTFQPGLWQGITPPKTAWEPAFDPLGQYVQVEGTSFASPVVAGVVALMRSADPDRKLTRSQLLEIVRGTASYQPLKITQKEQNLYRLQKGIPSTTILDSGVPISQPGIVKPTDVLPIEQYYFGTGLVNAAAAVDRVKQQIAAR